MFVLHPPHLVSLRVFFPCRAHSLCSRLICPFHAFPRPWPLPLRLLSMLPGHLPTWGYSHLRTHSFPSFSSLPIYCLVMALYYFPKASSRSLQPPASAPTFPLPPRLPPSFPSHRLRGHLGSSSLELGSDSSNRFLVTPPREAFPLVGMFSPFPLASADCGLASPLHQHQPSAGSRLSVQRVRWSLPPGRDQVGPVLDAVYLSLLYKVPYYVVSTPWPHTSWVERRDEKRVLPHPRWAAFLTDVNLKLKESSHWGNFPYILAKIFYSFFKTSFPSSLVENIYYT